LGGAAINMEIRAARQGRSVGAACYPRLEPVSKMKTAIMPSLLKRLFARTDPAQAMQPLYRAIVAEGRQPHWYVEGAVPDTLDGRFDMIVAILAFVLLRLEGEDVAQQSVWLTELFIDDMSGQLRQEGIGDVVVGKHLGRMVSALGGRLAAYRAALSGEGELGDALERNLYRSESPSPGALAHVETALRVRWDRLAAVPRDRLLDGDIR
jgi:cytochrome b pre-mRNA-processing protein 3